VHRLRDGDRRRHRTALTDPADIVARGYDEIADRFAEWQGGVTGSQRDAWIQELLGQLGDQPTVLELGVGGGGPSRALAERAKLTGVDVSAEQLRRARESLPHATLIHADFTHLQLPSESFNAVAAFYVLNHVPQERVAPLLRSVSQWLRPGGFFLATFPTSDLSGWTGEWLGTEMFFAGLDPATNRRLVEAAGLEVLRDERETMVEPDYGEVTWQWLFAQKPR
jgi:cyclopropane fatty-acyl-phospholipid synthase-like methyltransferase